MQHWIRLEMQTDVVVSRLEMHVDPNDSSYMPSLVIVSGGETVQGLKELKTVSIGSSEKIVPLLIDMSQVSLGTWFPN